MRKTNSYILYFITVFCCCNNENSTTIPFAGLRHQQSPAKIIEEIPVPPGFKRITLAPDSYGAWTRKIPLRSDNKVLLYNGKLKQNQLAQFAVLDLAIGNKDLQQCADIILRLRAEYFLSLDSINLIKFRATDGTGLSYSKWLAGERFRLVGNSLYEQNTGKRIKNDRTSFDQFMEFVFSYCGTISLDSETHYIKPETMQIGDMLVKPGSPGHAMLIVDLAVNQSGEKIFMLAQGYMPAQDIHIVKNPLEPEMGPWFRLRTTTRVVTPEWIFNWNELKSWQE